MYGISVIEDSIISYSDFFPSFVSKPLLTVKMLHGSCLLLFFKDKIIKCLKEHELESSLFAKHV